MKRYNTDESWDIGAIGRYADPGNGNDLDWGVYDMGTHHINGDSIFIIKLADGTYKKFAVESLISGTFTFKYANLDGSNELQKTIKKTDYADRMFAYVSMQNNQLLNREPAKDKWDLLFTQYTNMAISYTVTGVLQNENVEIAEVNGLSNKETYNDYFNHTYSDNISTIGYDWKTFDMQNNVYKIKDSTVYLVLTQDQGDEYWKMIFTGFDNTNGKFAFTKQRLFSTSINDNTGNNAASMTVFPNPATGAAINIAYNLTAAAENAALYVHDINGRVVYTSQLDKTTGMHQHVFSTANMPAGNYIVSIAAGTLRMQQQLSVVK
jgi:Secretion system C-terminal sorting domain